MTESGTVLLRFKLIAIDASSVTGGDMVMSLTSCVLRDSSVDFNRITTIPTTFAYMADAKLNSLATNLGDTTIYYHVSSKKPVGAAVSSFGINFAYNNTLFTNADIVDHTLTESKTTRGLINARPTSIITIRYNEAAGVDDFSEGSDIQLFRFKLDALNVSSIPSSSMVITLPSFVLYDTSIPIRLISSVTTQYTYQTTVGLQNIATNNDYVITIPAIIHKPVNEIS